MSNNDHWTMDKRIPIGVIGGLIFQACVLVWYGGQFAQRQADVERRMTVTDAVISKVVDDGSRTGERLARMEEKLSAQSDTLNRIESHMIPARSK